MRKSSSMSLREGCYTVLEAADGADAVEKYGSQPRHIHLMITDMILPGLSGVATARLMQRLAQT
ncbi:MAG: hypothetical protein HZA88_24290 [Verrucomicrobia bacterium]|nr:hypothetical protein [Verrucomicrobiota bacterium]